MDEAGTTGIYRAMTEEAGRPRLGVSATTLGVRVGIAIVPDAAGGVHRPAFTPGEPNGVSAAPTIGALPPFALPVEWGGQHARTAVWRIRAEDLGASHVTQEDGHPGRQPHVSIAPDGPMSAADYERAIQATCFTVGAGHAKRRMITMFKQELIKAWRAAQDHQSLLALAKRFHGEGQALRETYDILQQIWKENGLDDQEGGRLQNTLEAVMERVWYECPA